MRLLLVNEIKTSNNNYEWKCNGKIKERESERERERSKLNATGYECAFQNEIRKHASKQKTWNLCKLLFLSTPEKAATHKFITRVVILITIGISLTSQKKMTVGRRRRKEKVSIATVV